MDGFKITCVTCKARLAVRNASLIGQIVACPRCGNMVEIVAPAPAVPPVAAEPVTGSTVVIPPQPPVAEPDLPAEPPIPTEPIEPPAALPASNRFRWLAWASTSTAAAVLIGGAWLLRPTQPDVVDALERRETVAEPAATAPESRPEPPSEPSIDVPAKAEPQRPGRAPEPEADITADLPPLPKQTSADAEASVSDSSTQRPTMGSPPEAAHEPGDKQPQPSAVPAFDPLDFDPEGLNLSLLDTGVNRRGTEPSEQAEPEPLVDPALEDFGEPLAISRVVQLSEELSELATVSAEKALRFELPAFEARRMPLAEFLRLTGALSGAVITVDPDQLLNAAVRPDQPVAAAGESVTVGELLDQALKPMKLTARTSGPHILVERVGADLWREVDYPVDDIASDAEACERLARLLQTVIAPDAWTTRRGRGTVEIEGATLKIAQSERVQYDVLLLLERLRLAAKLPTRTRFPAKLLDTTGRIEAQGRLDQSTTYTLSQYTPLAEVFDHWADKLELPVFVDWPSLAGQQLWPDSQIRCYALDEPWRQAIDAVCHPLGLYWGVTDAGALRITSQTRATTQADARVYAVDAVSADAVRRAVKRFVDDLRSGLLVDAAQEDVQVLYHEPTSTLIARLPAAGHDALRQWLAGQTWGRL
ncbi:MAG: hypothetical protein AAGA92_02780 [Planctomycetota bacterium]